MNRCIYSAMWQEQLKQLQTGNHKVLARLLSLVENEQPGYEELLLSLPVGTTPVIGITGPPGAGKSTLIDALISIWTKQGKKVAVLCVDPSSPFHQGALLGDRIRMNNWYTHPDVYIRSLATRGSMGGLHPKIIELTDLLRYAGFDWIIVETVGVGQSEVEIAGLADVTAVVLVPEAGDEVQTMKSGLMEIADLFVVNKADRPDAGAFVKNLQAMLAPAFSRKNSNIPILQTTANKPEGVAELAATLETLQQEAASSEKKSWLMAEKAYRLIEQKRMSHVSRAALQAQIAGAIQQNDFNLYRFVAAHS
ncbi:MAG: methylmalonyl Co-A mutase-associated GTPase MeaB [Sphingomonadales bacterium]